MLDVKCDFCGIFITTRQNKGGEVKEFRLEENICTSCRQSDLEEVWFSKTDSLNKLWNIVRAEKEKFFNSLLRTQEKEWFESKKKEHFGSFYKQGGIKCLKTS